MVIVELPGEPVAKGRPRFARGHVYTPDKTRIYENSLALAARLAMRGRTLLEGPLTVVVYAFRSIPPTRRPDADNHLKILDALNGICWKDDAQIVDAENC